MRRIIVREARPGMRVTRHVSHPRDQRNILLATGTTLTVADVIVLHEQGIYDLWVEDPELGYLEQLQRNCSGDTAQQRLVEALARSFQTLAALGIDSATHPLLKRYRPAIEETVSQLVRTAPTLPCFKGLAQSDELLQHSTDVAVLSMLLGLQLEHYLVDQRRRLNCREARAVLNLTLGAFFHDVGETLLPPEQRESRVSLAINPEAGVDWRQHTQLGYQAVRKHLDPSGAAVVMHHHQHFDGSGFASVEGKELKGAAIHVFARIALVADMFFHLQMEPEAGMPLPAVHVLWQLQQRSLSGWFDPVILRGLLALLPPFAAGMVVVLNDRRPGVVTRLNETYPCYPEVQVLRDMEEPPVEPCEQIDLAQRAELRVVEVGGEDVGRYLFGTRQAQPLVAA